MGDDPARAPGRFEAFSFGSIRIDGTTYDHDVLIDRGEVRKRKKKPSKKFRDAFGHTPLSIEEAIPWKCRKLVIGTGTGALPVIFGPAGDLFFPGADGALNFLYRMKLDGSERRKVVTDPIIEF